MASKRIAAVFFFLAAITCEAQARDQLEDLKDVCSFPAADGEARLINATAMLVPAGSVHPTTPGASTYFIDAAPFYSTQGRNVCGPDDGGASRFYGETSVANGAGRTGVLIAKDLILTAAHTAPLDPMQWVVVFRASTATLGGTGCSNFTWSNIPADDVYYPVSHSTVMNSYVAGAGDGDHYDYAVFQLNRNVVGRAPMKIRRSGSPRIGDIAISPGYPNVTAEKVSSASVFAGVQGPGGSPYPGDYLYANHLNGFLGSSGSAIWHVEDETIDAVVAKTINTGFTLDSVEECWYAVDFGNITGSNGPLVDIASQVPRVEVLVAPLDYIDHDLLIHPPTPTFTNHYTATTARSGLGGELIDIEKIAWPTGTGDPNVSLSIPTGFYNVPAGGLSFDINADVSSVDSCGTWDYELNVHDITNDQNNFIRHHFDIGLQEYSVDRPGVWVVNDIGPPYQASQTYTITNVRDTSTHVMVSTDETAPDSNLILVNGGTGSASYNLAPHATATVTLTLNQTVAAATTPGIEYHGSVSFYIQPFACSTNPHAGYIHRNLTFKRGEQLVTGLGGGFLSPPPAGQSYGAPQRFDFDMSAEDSATCVGDINLYLGVPNPPYAPTVDQVAPYLKIQLTGPSGLSRVLWQGNAILPGSPYVSSTDIAGGTLIPALYLDDQVAPPLGGSLLSSFSNKFVKGHWYLDVSTSRSSGFVIGPAKLDFTRGPPCHPIGM